MKKIISCFIRMNKVYFFAIAILFFTFSQFTSLSQDLIITDVSGSKTVTQYTTLSVDVTIKNQGIVSINETFLTNAYLSTDSVRSWGDVDFSGEVLSTLAANGQMVITLSGKVSLNPGTYYLLVITDGNNLITETDETNNQTVIASYVVTAPNVDLSFASLTYAGLTVAPYDCMFPTYKIQNNGTTAISSVHTNFYLSTDKILDASDRQLDYGLYSRVGDVSSDDLVPIPAVTNGSYYIIARTDDYSGNSEYNETNESNNTQVTAITIKSPNIDLDAASTSYHPSVDTYRPDPNSIEVTYELKNNGTTGALRYDIAVYLSTDSLFDEGTDLLAWTTSLNHFSYYIGPSTTDINSVDVPVNNLSGSYYLVLKFNPTGSMPETDLSNNTVITTAPITITPPTIQLTSASVKGTPTDQDKNISITAEFSNPSTTTFFADLVSYETEIINSAGIPVAYDFFTTYLTVAPGMTQQEQYNISLTEPLPAGNYTILFKCDDSRVCTSNSFTAILVIKPSEYSFNGSIRTAMEGTPLSNGKLFLYQKDIAGKVKFTEKKDPLTTSNFDFLIDDQFYTLYFIPDPIAYPKAIPTILGKTIVLNDASFIRLTGNYTTVLEVLEITPLTETGSKVISGNVNTELSGGRVISGRDLTTEPIPVVLLSDTGIPVAITYADAEGNYKFSNLPDGNYNLLLSREPDQPQMPAPVAIDVTVHSAEVNFDLTGTTPISETKIQVVTGIDETLPVLEAYPNPTKDWVRIPYEVREVSVVDALGRTERVILQDRYLDLTSRKPGLYFIKVNVGSMERILKVSKE